MPKFSRRSTTNCHFWWISQNDGRQLQLRSVLVILLMRKSNSIMRFYVSGIFDLWQSLWIYWLHWFFKYRPHLVKISLQFLLEAELLYERSFFLRKFPLEWFKQAWDYTLHSSNSKFIKNFYWNSWQNIFLYKKNYFNFHWKRLIIFEFVIEMQPFEHYSTYDCQR